MKTRKEISEFYRNHRMRLYNTALRITGDQMDAEEVMQDTIIKYLNSEDGTLTDEQVDAWLFKTCVRASIDVIRRKKRSDEFLEVYKADNMDEVMEDQVAGAWNTIVEENKRTSLIKRIRQAISSLPDGYRTVLSLILFEGYDYEEAAQILEVKEVTIRSQYMRGKMKLTELLRK